MKRLFTILSLLILFTLNSIAQQWQSFGADTLNSPPAFNTKVFTFYNDGNRLFVGGVYQYGGITYLNGCGIWDGNQWSAMQSGGAWAYSMAKYNGKMYYGGQFSDASSIPNTENIACWNGISWEALPNSYGGLGNINTVRSMTVWNDTLVIGANFPGGSATCVTAFNDNINDYFDIGSLPSAARDLEVYNGDLYAGGQWFTLKKYVGGTSYAAWQDVGGNLSYYIQDMDVDTFNNFLYVAGGFEVVDNNILTDNVAIWNGFYWEGIGYGNAYNSSAYAVTTYQGDVYLGLSWDTIAGVYTKGLARWDGHDWYMVGGGVDRSVFALEVFQDKLYIGGDFDSVAGQPQKAIACWSQPLDTVDCHYIQPRAFTLADTFYLNSGQADVQFYNNNAYVDSWAWDFGDGGTSINKDPLYHYHDTGTYVASVSVTHNNCPVKTATKTITILNGTNIPELDKENLGFTLYPNPTDDSFYVEITLPPNSNAELRISGINGHIKSVVPLLEHKTNINTYGWSSGIYLCNLFINGKFVLSEKMVVKK